MTSPTWVPIPAAHVSESFLDDEAVLFDAKWVRPLLLNHSAAAVWAMIDGVLTVADITAELAAVFGVDVAVVAADVDIALASFVELGLLHT